MIHSVPTRRSYDLVAARTDKLHPLDLDRNELGERRGIGMGELRHLALGIADIDVGGQQHAVARIEKTTVGEWRDLADMAFGCVVGCLQPLDLAARGIDAEEIGRASCRERGCQYV